MAAVRALAIFLAFGFASEAHADMIETDGLAPYEVCALCHSLDGVSRMAKFPKLAGQPTLYLEKQIKDFISGHRMNDGGQMVSIVSELDPEDIPAAAEWFSNQPHPVPDPPTELVVEGEALFEDRNCAECHAGGRQQSPLQPYLRAQHPEYLAKQMTDFRDGDRQNDAGQVMQKKMIGLSDDQISALADYLAATPRPEN